MSSEAEFDRKIEAEQADLQKLNKAARRRNLMIVWLAVVSVIFGVFCAWLASENNRLATANAQYGAEQAKEKKTIAKEAQTALCGTKDSEIYDKAICEKLAEVAEEPAPPVAVPPVPGGPSQAELVEAFRKYCAEGNCRGKDGAAPTADDIAAAFVKFCSTRDGCRGPAGKDAPPAKDGKDGADGKPGADGVGPTQEMALAVLTSYCATRDECRGPAGATGATGASGPPPPEEAIIAAVQKVCASSDICRGPAGADGSDGVDGKDGADGKSPSSFSFTWAGTQFTCTPNPPGSTTYACDPANPGPPVIGVIP